MPPFVPAATQYVRLAAICVTQRTGSFEVQLLCEEDEGVDAFRVSCVSTCAFYLRPYAQWLRAYLQGESVDQPIIPVRFAGGSAAFDQGAAELDHPELADELIQFLNAGQTPCPVASATFLQGLSVSG